jgi:DNA-binding transcriptional MerR regulator
VKPLRISDLADRVGVSVATIRFYERKGLIPAPARVERNNYRAYAEADVETLRAVRRAQDLGFTLREIRQLVLLRKLRQADVKLAVIAREKLAEVEKEIVRATAARKALARVVDKPDELRALLLGDEG